MKSTRSDDNSEQHLTKPYGYDSNWKASMPYPTWPFTRVNPKELMKAERMWQRQNKTDPLEDMEEAPL